MKETSKWWGIGGNHNYTSHSSSWLNSTLSELDAKTKEILRVIDEVDDEADTFVKRAKNYYEKKPKLIAMVEDSYRSHRSLAHKYDLLMIKHSPLVPSRHNSSAIDEFRSDLCEETEFEVDVGEGKKDQIVEFGDDGEKMKDMKEELERLREENRVYKEMMSEKRQVTSLFTTNSIIRLCFRVLLRFTFFSPFAFLFTCFLRILLEVGCFLY